jgi:ABC-type lipoprotein release transport system permease subunit
MKLILRIAFRNLFRRKGRSILMGLGICLSMMIIVIGYSFSKGLNIAIINKMVDAHILGHFAVNMTEKNGGRPMAIIRDRAKLIEKINEKIKNIKEVREAIHSSVFAIGNGKGNSLNINGVDELKGDILAALSIKEGSITEFGTGRIENPLVLEAQSAERLNVKTGDIVKIRLRTAYKQIQTARLTVIAIVEFKDLGQLSQFIQGVMPLKKLKELMGYQPDEAQSLSVVLNKLDETKDIVTYADQLHKNLTSEPVSISVTFGSSEQDVAGTMAGLLSDKASVDIYSRQIKVLKGDIKGFPGADKKILIGKSLAEVLRAEPGMDIAFSFQSGSSADEIKSSFNVAAIIEDYPGTQPYTAFINDRQFYDVYKNYLSLKGHNAYNNIKISKDSPLIASIARNWILADRTYTYADWQKRIKKISKGISCVPVVDVTTMKEMAQSLFQLESGINFMCFIAMMIVFVIILVGIVNSVRMNIRERIKEIGTVRAVGMQKKTVARILVLEIGLLALLSVTSGIVMAYITMDLLSILTFPVKNNILAVFLSDGHLLFIPPIRPVVIYAFVIIIMTMLSAYLPARRAAKMPVAEALGHYE